MGRDDGFAGKLDAANTIGIAEAFDAYMRARDPAELQRADELARDIKSNVSLDILVRSKAYEAVVADREQGEIDFRRALRRGHITAFFGRPKASLDKAPRTSWLSNLPDDASDEMIRDRNMREPVLSAAPGFDGDVGPFDETGVVFIPGPDTRDHEGRPQPVFLEEKKFRAWLSGLGKPATASTPQRLGRPEGYDWPAAKAAVREIMVDEGYPNSAEGATLRNKADVGRALSKFFTDRGDAAPGQTQFKMHAADLINMHMAEIYGRSESR